MKTLALILSIVMLSVTFAYGTANVLSSADYDSTPQIAEFNPYTQNSVKAHYSSVNHTVRAKNMHATDTTNQLFNSVYGYYPSNN